MISASYGYHTNDLTSFKAAEHSVYALSKHHIQRVVRYKIPEIPYSLRRVKLCFKPQEYSPYHSHGIAPFLILYGSYHKTITFPHLHQFPKSPLKKSPIDLTTPAKNDLTTPPAILVLFFSIRSLRLSAVMLSPMLS